jgi:hypothetical protein
MKHNVGILIFGDPTRGGTIASEVKFLKSLYEQNSANCDFYIITVNDSVTKKILKEKDTTYNFPHRVVKIFGEEDFGKLDYFSCIVTYPGHSNFFGGYLNDNVVKMYKIISYMTNVLHRPVFIRINDSEIKVRDYRLLSEQRLVSGRAAIAEGKEANAFMRDPLNVAKAENLVTWTQWDYTKVYWFANGSREACDWVAETMFDREDESCRMAPRQTFVDNAIYVSDDIFFLVKKNYERFKKYDLLSSAVWNGHREPYVKDKFCYIGFFDTVNMARAKAFHTLFKENSYNVPMKIFGKGTEILTKLAGKTNIEVEEGFIKGDSEEYFDFLNQHLAYIFIGKGQSEARYIGKTVYDCIVARTPVVVYKKCDSRMITFSNPEFYFENERELSEIHKKLNYPEIRERWIREQQEEIFRKLPPSDFRFISYCTEKLSLPEDLCFTGYAVKEKPIKAVESMKQKSLNATSAVQLPKPKAISLF